MKEPIQDNRKEQPIGRHLRARRWMYDLIQSPEVDLKRGKFVRTFIAVIIVSNVIVVMLETIGEVNQRFHELFFWIEVFSVAIFTLEYILRLWVVVEDPRYSRPFTGRLRYSVSFFALIDLMAIIPFYLPMFFKIDMRALRILRLLRLVRVLKLGRYSRAARIFVGVLRNQREQLVISLLAMLLLLIASSAMIYYLEHDAQPEAFPSIPASLWWGIVTLTTIGYGDVYPVTVSGKICAAIISVLSIGMVALPSGIIVSGFIDELDEQRGQNRKEDTTSEGMFCPNCGNPLRINVQLHNGTTHDEEQNED